MEMKFSGKIDNCQCSTMFVLTLNYKMFQFYGFDIFMHFLIFEHLSGIFYIKRINKELECSRCRYSNRHIYIKEELNAKQSKMNSLECWIQGIHNLPNQHYVLPSYTWCLQMYDIWYIR